MAGQKPLTISGRVSAVLTAIPIVVGLASPLSTLCTASPICLTQAPIPIGKPYISAAPRHSPSFHPHSVNSFHIEVIWLRLSTTMGDDIIIFHDDLTDSDNWAAAGLLAKAAKSANVRVIWIIEPRQVSLSLYMSQEDMKNCVETIMKYFVPPTRAELEEKKPGFRRRHRGKRFGEGMRRLLRGQLDLATVQGCGADKMEEEWVSFEHLIRDALEKKFTYYPYSSGLPSSHHPGQKKTPNCMGIS